MRVTRGFDHYQLWDALDVAFKGKEHPVVKGSRLHYTPSYEAKQLAVVAVLKLQEERMIMSERDFNRLFGSIAAIGFVIGVLGAVFYFMRLPIFDERALAWALCYGLIAAGVAALALILRSIWNAT